MKSLVGGLVHQVGIVDVADSINIRQDTPPTQASTGGGAKRVQLVLEVRHCNCRSSENSLSWSDSSEEEVEEVQSESVKVESGSWSVFSSVDIKEFSCSRQIPSAGSKKFKTRLDVKAKKIRQKKNTVLESSSIPCGDAWNIPDPQYTPDEQEQMQQQIIQIEEEAARRAHNTDWCTCYNCISMTDEIQENHGYIDSKGESWILKMIELGLERHIYMAHGGEEIFLDLEGAGNKKRKGGLTGEHLPDCETGATRL
ncbi:hypothetical protein B566_EDAN009756 [Ephemera danica]|nr:hypothetical protein B566_EDAN009756 [Ephemera danica]